MKILQFCKKLPYPPKDGESIAILNFSRAFVELGHEVTILAINTNRHYYDPGNIAADLKEKIDFKTVRLNTDVTIVDAIYNLVSSDSYFLSRFRDSGVTRMLASILKKDQYDVIQIEGLYGLDDEYLKTIEQYSTNSTIVSYRAHNVEHQIWERIVSNEGNPLKKAYLNLQTGRLKRFETSKLNAADCVIPITPLDQDNLQKQGLTKPVHVSPASIIADDWNMTVPKIKTKKIGFLGGLDWIPNQEGLQWFLNNVFPSVVKNHPDVQFEIAGRNQPKWAKEWENGYEKQVSVVGEVDSAAEFMLDKSIMIVPLLSGSGMRIKIIEAMAARKVVVATSIAAEGINAENGSAILIEDDAEKYANAINNMLDDNVRNTEIGDNARAFAQQNFDYLAVSKKLLEFYNSLRAS